MTDVLIDARRGAGSSLEILYGTVTWKPTLTHSRGTSIVLPAPTTFDLVDGQVVATNVQPTPEPVEGQIEWAYEVTFKDRHSKTYSFLVGVPDSTSQVNFASLPRYFETAPPLFGQGPQGLPGEAATIEIGSVSSGATPSVNNSGTNTDAVLNFVLPKGDKGDTGTGVPTGGSALQYVRKNSGNTATEWATLDKASVGLSNVDNTADEDKPISTEQTSRFEAIDASIASMSAGLDESVEELVNLEGSGVQGAVLNLSEIVTQGKIEAHPLDQFKRAYFKRIKHVLPFRFPDFAGAMTLWASGGFLYPQAFQVDTVSRELFIVYAGAGYQVVVIWDWDTSTYKSCFGVVSNYVSEGAEILYEGNQRFLYLRTLSNSMQKFNITTLPDNFSTLTASSTISTKQGINFTYRDGSWTMADPTPIKGLHASRGLFKILDSGFSPVGTVNFGELEMGGNPYKYQNNSVPKMQGICDAGGYYAVNIGGFQSRAAEFSPYGLQGTRIFTRSGQLLVDSLIDPLAMMDILESEGLSPSRVEGEGIQLVDGKLTSLLITSSYGPGISDTEGIVFLEEFSDSADAIDFTSAAASWATPNVDHLQVGGFPRTIEGSMHEPVTGEVLDSVAKITEYMKAVNQTYFTWYTSSVTVQDVTGTNLPTGMWVTLINTNNSTFFMTWTGGRNMTWQVYPSGGTLVKAQIHPVVLGDDNTTYYRIRVNTAGQVTAAAI